MNPELVSSINSLSQNVQSLSLATRGHSFWDTQWFAAIMGAIAALLATWAKEYLSARHKRLKDFYDWAMDQNVFFSPDSVLKQARITSYAYTLTRDGVTTQVPEKTLSEKAVIEFRKHAKYWRLPISYARYKLRRYEKCLDNLPEKTPEEIKTSNEYKKAVKCHSAFVKFLEKKTGDNQWTR